MLETFFYEGGRRADALGQEHARTPLEALGQLLLEALGQLPHLAVPLEAIGQLLLVEAEPLQPPALLLLEASERTSEQEEQRPGALTMTTSVNKLLAAPLMMVVLGQLLLLLEEAEPLQPPALGKASERTLGQETHPGALTMAMTTSVNNLLATPLIKKAFGQLLLLLVVEAEPLQLQALEASERTLGREEEHPGALTTSVNNLAASLLTKAFGQLLLPEAEPLQPQALLEARGERTLLELRTTSGGGCGSGRRRRGGGAHLPRPSEDGPRPSRPRIGAPSGGSRRRSRG